MGSTVANPIYLEATTPPKPPTVDIAEEYDETEIPEYGGVQGFVDCNTEEYERPVSEIPEYEGIQDFGDYNNEGYETPKSDIPVYEGFEDFVYETSAKIDLTEDRYVTSERRQTLRLSTDKCIAPVTQATDEPAMRYNSKLVVRNNVADYDLVEPDMVVATNVPDIVVATNVENTHISLEDEAGYGFVLDGNVNNEEGYGSILGATDNV